MFLLQDRAKWLSMLLTAMYSPLSILGWYLLNLSFSKSFYFYFEAASLRCNLNSVSLSNTFSEPDWFKDEHNLPVTPFSSTPFFPQLQSVVLSDAMTSFHPVNIKFPSLICMTVLKAFAQAWVCVHMLLVIPKDSWSPLLPEILSNQKMWFPH